MIWNRIFILMGIAWLGQVILTWWQVRDFQRTVQDMARRPEGFLGVGTHRKWLRRGAVVILVTDSTGRITAGKALTGATVFSRPKPYTQWDGQALHEAMSAAADGKPRTALLEASVSALEQIQAQWERANATEQAEADGVPVTT